MSALPFVYYEDGRLERKLLPDLTESQRLLDSGMMLVSLHPYTKQPSGLDWNKTPATSIDPKATGYGLPLAANGLCSIDPDHVEMARAGLKSWGFDLDKLLSAGVRTSSTRPGSGGRSAFAADIEGMARWLTFKVFDDEGNSTTVLELRAKSENLQDCVPGVVYVNKATGELCTQQYANENRFDDAPQLPDSFARFWRYLSLDDDALREYDIKFCEALTAAGFKVNGKKPQHRPQMGSGKKLAFQSDYRAGYNSTNKVEQILDRHGYKWHAREQRYSHHGATGAPGIRLIPGKDDLWQSDHAGDPLHGTFDPWAAHVQLDHNGDLAASEEAERQKVAEELKDSFTDDTGDTDTDSAEEKPKQEWKHPLTKILDPDNASKPPTWILPHFIGTGVAIIAGAHGVGKTTAILPLAMAAAGLHENDYPLAPREWRHVVYITEDSHQAGRIIAGYAPTIGQTPVSVGERLHVVEAARMPTDAVVIAGQWYQERYTRTVTTATGREVDLLPLIVFDTKAAVFEMENDNDNSEASKMIAAIKQKFAGLPTWIVGHVSKGDLSRDGAKSGMPTFRGASAFEADAHQVLYLVKEKDDTRWLVRGKTRFEAKWDELRIESYSSKKTVLNDFDEQEELTLRWAVARPQGKTRVELNAEADAEAKRKQDADKKHEIVELINKTYEDGEPLNRTEVAKEIGGNAKATKDLIRDVIESGWVVEISVPSAMRTHPKRNKFLVGLTMGQRKQYLADGTLPPELSEIPETWRKQPKPTKEESQETAHEESEDE
jgi:RecA-family ATPase